MTSDLTNTGHGVARLDAQWLADPDLQGVFNALVVEGDEARAVGGVVRNTLLQVPITDIDIATTAAPETVMARARAAGLKAVPTGIDHGTITIVAGHRPFEVTTLRVDVETFGRKAKVRFGRDWQADANRRDFTMNALYVDRNGALFDPVDGYGDCLSRRVRFIGDPRQRIREDYLRILRFFRFHATYGAGPIDADGLDAVEAERAGLTTLSAERVGHELNRLVVTPGAAETLAIMTAHRIAEPAFGTAVAPDRLLRLQALAEAVGEPVDAALAYTALAVRTPDDALALSRHLRLSNAVRDRMIAIARAADDFTQAPSAATVRENLYRLGHAVCRGALLIAWTRGKAHGDDPRWTETFALADSWQTPQFPLAGRDLIAAGVPAGPRIGALMEEAERWWIADGFRAGRDEVLARALAADEA